MWFWPFKKEKKYIKLLRRGYYIYLDENDYNTLKRNNILLSIIFNRKNVPSSVQLTMALKNEDNVLTHKYVGTLKSIWNVKCFKNKNILDFRKENLIFNENGDKNVTN